MTWLQFTFQAEVAQRVHVTTSNPIKLLLSFMIYRKKIFAIFAASMLSACGGDGILDTEKAITVRDNVIVVDGEGAREIISTTSNESGTSISVSSDSSVGNSMRAGSVISVLAGTDPRWPLGLSAKISAVTNQPDGSKKAELERATLADVIQNSAVISQPIELIN